MALQANETTVLCLGCGLEMAPRAGVMVCSPVCRQRERRARRRRSRRAVCVDCGDVFVPGRSDKQYCSLTCKERSHRERRKAAPGGPQMAQDGLLSTPGTGPRGRSWGRSWGRCGPARRAHRHQDADRLKVGRSAREPDRPSRARRTDQITVLARRVPPHQQFLHIIAA